MRSANCSVIVHRKHVLDLREVVLQGRKPLYAEAALGWVRFMRSFCPRVGPFYALITSFWLGFEISGIVAVLVLFSCELFPSSPWNRLVMSYTAIIANLAFTHLPTPLADHLDEHWDLFLAVVYFVPELVATLLGGMITACLIPRGLTPARTIL